VLTVIPAKDVPKAATRADGEANLFRDLTDYLDYAQGIAVAVVGTIGDETLENPTTKSTSYELFTSQLAGCGFEVQGASVNLKSFGLPTFGLRLAFAAYDPTSTLLENKKIDVTFVKFLENLTCMRRGAPSVDDMLLDADDPVVERNLSHRLVAPYVDPKKNWAEDHIREYGKRDARWGDVRHWFKDVDKESPWFGTLSEREVDALALNLGTYPKTLIFHIDQNIALKTCHMSVITSPEGGGVSGHLAPAQQVGARAWIRGNQIGTHKRFGRLQLGMETMMFNGFPIRKYAENVNEMNDELLHTIGAKLLAPPLQLAWLASLLGAVPWKQAGNGPIVVSESDSDDEPMDSHGATSSDAATALDLFKSFSIMKK
jgi:hypothetical protein